MTNAEKFKEVFGKELSFDEYVIRCHAPYDGSKCKTCKYSDGLSRCFRYKWADEEYKEQQGENT